ncbi:GtrA family protein [Lacticaseibacillus parakribbianus]|uniref:GtrA family protein n=1 Tax=Lacticaseibacillus parakribbianus TaxID=2970927 RepID=UPI0021CB0C0C|nr:GtrA family protein [Lacticaseibacillus parakribbianus]
MWRRSWAWGVAHREPLLYLWFGAWTTVVNIAVFWLAQHGLGWHWAAANFWAWSAAVLFAFATNRRYVFAVSTRGAWAVARELARFVLARLATLGLDYLCMWGLIAGLHAGDLGAKLVTQVVVVLANYALSKWLVFR